MTSLSRPPTSFTTRISVPQIRSLGSWKVQRPLHGLKAFPQIHLKHTPLPCSKFPAWESSSLKYATNDDDDSGGSFLKETGNIFESMDAKDAVQTLISDKQDDVTEIKDQSSMQFQPLKWPMWLLGPLILLITGMAPTLWLPLSSVYLGANTASLLSLVGLDCLFNIGVNLFLLMADACARPKSRTEPCNSQAPVSYRFWNMVANVVGFAVPLLMLYANNKIFNKQMPFISFAVLLGPYLLLLSIQMLTESLTWYWQSPVWLVTPVVYESYRVLQLMRGLRLAVDMDAPTWIMDSIRVLVSGWVLILGIQIMRVAWFAGITEQKRQQA